MKKCIDRCHKDGVIKLEVEKNPDKYITYDPDCNPIIIYIYIYIYIMELHCLVPAWTQEEERRRKK